MMNGERDFRAAMLSALALILVLWLILMVDGLFDLQLVRFGVLPRDPGGLIGVLLAPLIHASWYHLLANTGPLFVLGTLVLYGYPRASRWAIPAIYLLSGIGVWLFGRYSFHIGASGVSHGLMFFIFTIGVLRRDRLAIVFSMVVFFLYGGMIWGIFPQKLGVSFESHLFGAVSGVLMAVLLRNLDPALPEKKYDWEEEEDSEPE